MIINIRLHVTIILSIIAGFIFATPYCCNAGGDYLEKPKLIKHHEVITVYAFYNKGMYVYGGEVERGPFYEFIEYPVSWREKKYDEMRLFHDDKMAPPWSLAEAYKFVTYGKLNLRGTILENINEDNDYSSYFVDVCEMIQKKGHSMKNVAERIIELLEEDYDLSRFDMNNDGHIGLLHFIWEGMAYISDSMDYKENKTLVELYSETYGCDFEGFEPYFPLQNVYIKSKSSGVVFDSILGSHITKKDYLVDDQEKYDFVRNIGFEYHEYMHTINAFQSYMGTTIAP